MGRKAIGLGLIAITIFVFQNCAEMSPEQTLGEVKQLTRQWSKTFLKTNMVDAEKKAMAIFQRTGTKTAVDDPLVKQMKNSIEAGNAIEAARLAVNRDEFFNLVIRDFAAPMSNREEKVNVPLNDFIALVIGVARDNRDARELLTTDDFYWAPSESTATNMTTDVVGSNNHYFDLDDNFVNLAASLEVATQKVRKNGGLVDLADAAGLITSRAFMSAHAAGGTNRRLVEFSFSQFLCSPIDDWAGGLLGQGFIGRDISRKPSEVFDSKCSRCHAPMDSMRPAFAHVDFKDGFLNFREITTVDPDPNDATKDGDAVPAAEQLVPSKFRRGKEIFFSGHIVTDDTWRNFTSANFGWRSATYGSGMKEFGKMIADSREFSRCMSRRAFQTLCYRPLHEDEFSHLDAWADHFESSGYSLKELFARVVSDDLCTGGL